MLAKINKIRNWQAALIIGVLGFAAYSTGLTSPFQGDDIFQIVNNVPVHSITHIRLFFEGGTFYNQQGLAPLSGSYFRPLMTTSFSLIYSLFGLHSFYFHLYQLMLCIGSAFILYLFFKYSFKPAPALFLALVFLLHPLNSQVAFSIPYLEDALYFFFGILGLYLLMRFKSSKSLIAVVLCLTLSLFSKETGLLFVILSILYLFWWERKRLKLFFSIFILPFILYVSLRLNAVGLDKSPNNAPIDRLHLWGRLMTEPSIILFYLSKFIFPWRLASGYYWVHPTFSLRYFILPLMIDLIIMAAVIYLAVMLRRHAPKALYYTYLFFTIWSLLGLIIISQIVPLDMTVCETWIYFSMAGVLGMIGVLLTAFPFRIHPKWLILVIGMILISLLGARTTLRGFDWGNLYTLAKIDITASPDDYNADIQLATSLTKLSEFNQANQAAEHAVAIYPTADTYNALGTEQFVSGNYSSALKSFMSALNYSQAGYLYENIAALSLWYGNPSTNIAFINNALSHFGNDGKLWLYMAILLQEQHDNNNAVIAITNASKLGVNNPYYYDHIINNQPLTLPAHPTL